MMLNRINHSNKTLSSKQDHYLSESKMVHASPNNVMQLNQPPSIIIGNGHERMELGTDPNKTTFISDNNSILSLSASSCSK